MFQRIPLMQQADAAGGGTGAAAGAAGAGAGAAAGAAADNNGQQQQAGQQGKAQEGAASSQAGTQQDTTKGTQSTDAAKGTGADKAKTGDQAQIAIKLQPESKADPKFVEAYTAQAKKLGLSQEAAQGAWDFFSQAQAEGAKAFEGALQKQVATDVQALMADKEFGGANFQKTVAARDSALKQFFGEDTAKLFKDLGIDTNPGVAKGLARIRALISEDSVGDKGGKPPASMTTREAELRQLFPNSYDQMVPKRA